MLVQLLALATIAVSCVSAQNSTNVTVSEVVQAFDSAKVVPDVLPSFNPTGLLSVVFLDNTTGTSVSVTPGLNLTREQNALLPLVFLTSNDTSLAQETFVLAMVDPDAPTPQNPSAAQIRHLLAPGLRTNGSLATGASLVNTTPAISNFLRPSPPAGSDPHRYTLLLFVQPANFTTVAPKFVNASTPINNFNISLFAQEVGLGSPVAGNFFLTGPDANSGASTNGTNSTNSTNSTSSTNSTGDTTGTASGSSAASVPTSPAPSADSPSSAMGRVELSAVGFTVAVVLLGVVSL
ncbi:phosphatidylethanolamine-binding protein [Trametes elegans]|nr:phosphatidylethanolamine-binding protein [Trametes elegans]